jgi:hypothetical protein
MENEIVASDGAVLYRFDPDTSLWVEAAITLTAERFGAMSDEEIRAAAPAISAAENGLPAELTLTPSEIMRGGEGGNYVLYRSSRYDMVEMAWNAESGEIMHAAYGPAQTYDLGGGMIVTGLSILFLNSPAMVEHDNGWFGPNPDERYYGTGYNPSALQSPELRLTEAFMRSLGTGYWFRNLHRGDIKCSQYERMPSLAEVPGFEAYVKHLLAQYTIGGYV